MIYKAGILGCSGRMGLEICEMLAPGFLYRGDCMELADPVSRTKKLTSIEGVSVRTLSEPPREPVHVWIDFSRPAATVELLKNISAPIVIGTTGFTPEELEAVKAYSQKYPVLLAANTSPGMNLLYRLLSELGHPQWASETVLFEEHHRFKKDSPSGTAKDILKLLEANGTVGAQVISVRGGSNPGTHSIRFLGDFEEIEVTHRVRDRKVFAKGAIVAALALLKKKEPGLYSYSQIVE